MFLQSLTLAAAIVSGGAVPFESALPIVSDSQPASPYELVARAAAPAIVNVKFVMSFEGGPGGEEASEENEVHGVIIDPSGIVLISSASMFGYDGMGFQVRPSDIKIMVGSDTEGLAAKVLVRDRDRDLAWLKITDEVEEVLPAIDFGNGGKASLGQRLLQVWKLDKFFDRAPYVSEGKVAAIVSKPRDLFIAAGEVTMGLPVFAEGGSPLGFVVLQLPTQEEMAAMSGSNMFAQMAFTRTVLPAAEVSKATAAAMASLEDEEE